MPQSWVILKSILLQIFWLPQLLRIGHNWTKWAQQRSDRVLSVCYELIISIPWFRLSVFKWSQKQGVDFASIEERPEITSVTRASYLDQILTKQKLLAIHHLFGKMWETKQTSGIFVNITRDYSATGRKPIKGTLSYLDHLTFEEEILTKQSENKAACDSPPLWQNVRKKNVCHFYEYNEVLFSQEREAN